MKRLATLVLMAGLSLGSVLGLGQGASATPFSDVPANHWAYQALQSLAADGLVEGYPDGKFKGDRPLSRYEMAVLVARVIAKVEANGASKADLDKLQKLIQALKDELDALGVRVTNLEDSLDALDKRTKFAQSIQFHGTMLPQQTIRNRTTLPKTVPNGTGIAQPLYYGGTVAAAAPGGILPQSTSLDPMIGAFISSDPSNSAYTQAGTGVRLRYDDKFSFSYAITDALTVSLPFHLASYTFAGDFQGNNTAVNIVPGVDILVKKTGNITNLRLKYGIQDSIANSRTGLTYRSTDASDQGTFENSNQPYPIGFQMGGTLNGLTDFQFTFTRLSNNLINTIPTVLDPTGVFGYNAYLFTVVPNSLSYTQTGAPNSAATLTSQTFTAGPGGLTQVFLNKKAQIGTVYVSQYNGTLFNNAGVAIGGAGASPGFTFDESYNDVVFATPLPAGSSVTVTYVGYGSTNAGAWQRFDFSGRLNQKFKGLPGAEVGISYNRIFDFADPAATTGYGLVSDSVLGIDFQTPIPLSLAAGIGTPVVFGEAAISKFTPDYNNTPATSDTAGVIGLRLKIDRATLSVQYQSVGPNFLDGAPFRYYGQPPQQFAYWKQAYFPAFFGFGNNLAINTQFDNQFAGTPIAGPVATGACVNTKTACNPNLTTIIPVFNPFQGGGPSYYSSFIPNTRGVTGTATIPFRIGDVQFNSTLTGQHLSEIRPLSTAQMQFGPTYASNQLETLDKGDGNLAFTIPAFGTKVALNIGGTLERLRRLDKTPFQYYPFNAGTQSFDPASVAVATQAFPAGSGAGTYSVGSQVSWYPNYIDMTHYVLNAGANIPIQKQLSLSLQYNSQTYSGTYATTNGQSISERKDQYQAGLTYAIPNTNSAVSFIARQSKYTDNVVPSFNFNQNRQDLTFTVRF